VRDGKVPIHRLERLFLGLWGNQAVRWIDLSDFLGFLLFKATLGMEIVHQKSHQKSLILLSRQLWNVGLERLFLGL
jgi:hypothetical protein